MQVSQVVDVDGGRGRRNGRGERAVDELKRVSFLSSLAPLPTSYYIHVGTYTYRVFCCGFHTTILRDIDPNLEVCGAVVCM